MNSLNISKIQRRKPKRSKLGTRSHGHQFNTTAQINDNVTKTNSTSTSIITKYMTRRPESKSVLDTRGKRKTSIFDMSSDKSCNSPLRIRTNVVEEVVANDSFEKNETFMMADEESILANSLLDSTVVEMTTVIPELKNDTIMPEVEDAIFSDLIVLLNQIIENNNRDVSRYHQQIEDIEDEIEEKNRQTKVITEQKCRLIKKFQLSEPMLSTNSTEQTESKSLKCSPMGPDGDSIVPTHVAVPSKQIIHELCSTIKFLRTPRSSECARKSIMLTPKSMTFSIKSQLEKLME